LFNLIAAATRNWFAFGELRNYVFPGAYAPRLAYGYFQMDFNDQTVNSASTGLSEPLTVTTTASNGLLQSKPLTRYS
jgi:hypothetical protein